MAIASDGVLYGWGTAYAVGLGTVKESVLVPTQIKIHVVVEGERDDSDAEEEGDEGEEASITSTARLHQQARRERRAQMIKDTRLASDVACGGGFTVCVLRSGHVCSWGMWAHGRLGQGPIPTITQNARRAGMRSGGQSKKIARYQLRPGQVYGIENAIGVSCGEAHAVCVLNSGAVLTWGQNSCGQLGIGPRYNGNLSDAFSPVYVAPFGGLSVVGGSGGMGGSEMGDTIAIGVSYAKHCNEMYKSNFEAAPKIGVCAVMVSAGAFHSACVDEKGGIWTWGGRGSPCLGHSDAQIKGEWSRRVNSIFSISATETSVMVPLELMKWCCQWSMPRRLESLGKDIGKVVQVTCGDLHTAILSEKGGLLLCGGEPVVPSFLSNSKYYEESEDEDEDDDEDDDDEDEDDEKEGEEGGEETKKKKAKIPNKDRAAEEEEEELRTMRDDVEKLTLKSTIVSTPRCPTASWLHEICMKKVMYVSSGGCKIMVILDEETIAHSVTAPLLHKLTSQATDYYSDDKRDSASISIASEAFSDISVFESRGKADCMVLASGKTFLCHKAILSSRSPELRNMIIMETPTDETALMYPIQILLPELQNDSARAFLFYLYRDVLPKWAIGDLSLLSSLARIARNMRVPRLQLLCEVFVKMATASATVNDTGVLIRTLDTPPCTLARDLGSLVGDPEFADVRFIAEGRAIMAHRFLLESRCDYFKAMFGSGMSEGSRASVLDVVVPDTFVGFLRLLIFIYTGTLPDASDGAILEDLMAADRYSILDMRILSENMILPSKSNWLDFLRAAELLDSKRLRVMVVGFLRDNVDILYEVFGENECLAIVYGDRCLGGESTGMGSSASSVSSLSSSSQALGSSIGGVEGVRGEEKKKKKKKRQDKGGASSSKASSLVPSDLDAFREEFPGLVEEIILSSQDLHPAPPSAILIDQITKAGERDLNEAGEKNSSFPWWAALCALISLYIYGQLSTLIVLGNLVPIVNVACMVALCIFGTVYMNSNRK